MRPVQPSVVAVQRYVMLSAVPSSGIVNSVIRITGIGDRDRPEWLIRINGMRSFRGVTPAPQPGMGTGVLLWRRQATKRPRRGRSKVNRARRCELRLSSLARWRASLSGASAGQDGLAGGAAKPVPLQEIVERPADQRLHRSAFMEGERFQRDRHGRIEMAANPDRFQPRRLRPQGRDGSGR